MIIRVGGIDRSLDGGKRGLVNPDDSEILIESFNDFHSEEIDNSNGRVG